MRQPVQKVISTLVATAMSLIGMAGYASASGQIVSAKATLSTTQPTVAANYTLNFSAPSATSATAKAIKLEIRRDPSVTTNVPTGLGTNAATFSALSVGGSDVSSGWARGDTGSPLTGTILLTNPAGTAVGSSAAFILTMNNITNNTIDNTAPYNNGAGSQCDDVDNTETCFIRISYYNSDTVQNGTTLIDSGVTTYTVSNGTSVTATVDPTLTFTVTGVPFSSVGTGGFDTGTVLSAADTPITSTSTTLPLGNLRFGFGKIGTQQLFVKTNAAGGYVTSMRMHGANALTGSFGTDNVDPFTGGGATYGVPKTWVTNTTNSPAGTTASVDSGYFGFRTDNAVAGTNFTSNKWAPVTVGTAGTGDPVMSKGGPDNGTTATNVSYKLEVNAYQPADTYSGVIVYNVVANY